MEGQVEQQCKESTRWNAMLGNSIKSVQDGRPYWTIVYRVLKMKGHDGEWRKESTRWKTMLDSDKNSLQY